MRSLVHHEIASSADKMINHKDEKGAVQPWVGYKTASSVGRSVGISRDRKIASTFDNPKYVTAGVFVMKNKKR